ncbi:MAG TPA: YcnI family protein [Gemmatimonadaceae bacterium]|jgi:uncharacterized protein YcnI|nr:YcnI family protein [Gemmatimonadaceae bacterium]
MRRAFRFAHRARRRRIALAAATTVLGLAVSVPTLSWAHAVVFPRRSTTGAYEKYVLRVPNEKAVPTTRVELVFPKDVRVTSFADVPGWQLEVVTDSAKAITAAIWTGTLPPARFVEFPFVAVNPKTDATLTWPAYQTYADGERVEWSGPEGSKRPASVTKIGAAAAAEGSDGGYGRWVPWAAVALSLVSLGLAIRKPVARPAT